MPDNVIEPWFRYICTYGNNCKEVECDYQPIEEELVFACRPIQPDLAARFKINNFACAETAKKLHFHP